MIRLLGIVWVIAILYLVWRGIKTLIEHLNKPVLKFRITKLPTGKYIIENQLKGGKWIEIENSNYFWKWKGELTGIEYPRMSGGFEKPHSAKATLEEMIDWIKTNDIEISKKRREVIKVYDFD